MVPRVILHTTVLMCLTLTLSQGQDSSFSSTVIRKCNHTSFNEGRFSAPRFENFYSNHLKCWYKYQLPSHLEQSHVIQLEFTNFFVGEIDPDTWTCGQNFMVIKDGEGMVNEDHDFGKFCGELDQVYSYFAEFGTLELVFQSDQPDFLDFEFEVSFVEKSNLTQRFGPRPDKFPHIRGNLVEGSLCERVFSDCSRYQACYVQSPGYPGVYPRNLKCRYYLSTKQPYIKLYGKLFHSIFDVASRDCDSLIYCPFYGIKERRCDKDVVRIYDGVDEYSPLIGEFCGIGELPASIVGTGNQLFLEFNTRSQGPFLGTGFDLRVTHLPGNIQSYQSNGSCHWIYKSEELFGKNEGIFLSLEHWYPPNTNCTYLMVGRVDQIVRLYFPSFQVGRIENPLDTTLTTGCREHLTIYDDSWPNGQKILKTFCDGFSRPLEKFDFISSSNVLFVEFFSATGSYSGSSLQFWAQYDFYDTKPFGKSEEGTLCDETFFQPRGSFASPRNTLIYKQPKGTLNCHYNIFADQRDYKRIEFELQDVNFKAQSEEECKKSCYGNERLDHIEISSFASGGATKTLISCFSSCKNGDDAQQSKSFVSKGPHVQLLLNINNRTSLLNYFKYDKPLFRARYEFVHPTICGPYHILASSNKQKVLAFPNQARKPHEPGSESDRVQTCVWDVQVERGRDFKISGLNFTTSQHEETDCKKSAVKIITRGNIKNLCPDLLKELSSARRKDSPVKVIKARELKESDLLVQIALVFSWNNLPTLYLEYD